MATDSFTKEVRKDDGLGSICFEIDPCSVLSVFVVVSFHSLLLGKFRFIVRS